MAHSRKLTLRNIHKKIMRVVHRELDKLLSTVNFSCFIITLALLAVFIFGTFEAYRLRGEIANIHSLHDAFYFSVVSMTTLGDGSMYPITPRAKSFVLSLLFFGFTTFATFISVVFYQVVLNVSSFFNKFDGGKVHMKNHVILCGYSLVTELVMSKLMRAHIPFLLIDNNLHPELSVEHVGNFLYAGTPSQQENLIKASISLCKVIIIASNLDSENILAAMNAAKLRKELGAHFKIIVRILYEENIEVARNNGADDVIAPTLMETDAIISSMELKAIKDTR
jgi:voltage-gated potassium channel